MQFSGQTRCSCHRPGQRNTKQSIPVQIISRKFPFKSLNLFIHVLLFKKAVHISLLGQALIPCKINTVLTKETEMPGLLLRAKASRVETGERHYISDFIQHKMMQVIKKVSQEGKVFCHSIQHKPSIQHRPLGFTEIDLFITISITLQLHMK